MLKDYRGLQKIFIPSMILFSICMNLGFIKYNDVITIVSIFGLTGLSLIGIWRYCKTCSSDITRETYKWWLIGVFFVFFIFQTLICLYVPLNYYSDFIIVREQAMHMARDYSLMPNFDVYFHSYPFQMDIVFIISALYSILGSYTGVEIFTSQLVNVSAILVAMTIYNITGNRRISVVWAIMFDVFSTFCLKTYMPYTANIGMIFPILMLYVYTLRINRILRIILLALVVAVGYRVKMTTIIPFIAMVIFGTYTLLKDRDIKTAMVGIVSFLMFSISITMVHNSLLNKVGFVNDDRIEHSLSFYLAMGQNNATGGQFSPEIAAMGDNIDFPSKEARDKYFLDIAKKNFCERSIIDHVKFFAAKIGFCWGETYIDHLYFCKWDKLLLILKHYTWYLAMTLMVIGTFFIRDKRYYMLQLGIWGAIAYLYLSEAGARYVLLYMPLVYVMAGWAILEYKRLKQ